MKRIAAEPQKAPEPVKPDPVEALAATQTQVGFLIKKSIDSQQQSSAQLADVIAKSNQALAAMVKDALLAASADKGTPPSELDFEVRRDNSGRIAGMKVTIIR